MINVAVCDDSEYDIQAVKDELSKYITKKHINLNTDYFFNPDFLLYELEDGKMFDIFILDVEMPNKNGFQLADEIRKFAPTAIIIFLTSHENMAVYGYKSKALRYIIKINIKQDFEEALNTAIDELDKLKEMTVTLHHYNDYWRVPHSDIVYIIRIKRQLTVNTVSYGDITDNRGLSEFFEQLNDNRFLFIDRSCFVNIDYISQISGFNLKLKTGQVLQISRRSMQSVKLKLLEYWG